MSIMEGICYIISVLCITLLIIAFMYKGDE